MWTLMALEEGGHAAVVRAVNRGLVSGVLRAKSFYFPSNTSTPSARS